VGADKAREIGTYTDFFFSIEYLYRFLVVRMGICTDDFEQLILLGLRSSFNQLLKSIGID
jgi:hypothetical protein